MTPPFLIPPVLIFLVFFMLPLRLSAMERLGDERNSNALRRCADAREHKRLATGTNGASEQDPQRSDFTCSAVDLSVKEGSMDHIISTSPAQSCTALVTSLDEHPTETKASSDGHSTLAVVTNNRRQQSQISIGSGGGASLPKLDGAAQARAVNIERVRSQISALVQKAKTINPDFAAIIDQWHQCDSDTRAHLIETQILVPGDSEEDEQRNQIAALLNQVSEMERTVAAMTTGDIDATSSVAETIAPAQIVQVPSQQKRAELALQNLKHENEILQPALNNLSMFIRATRTMIGLKVFDFIDTEGVGSAVWGNNPGFRWQNAVLLLNNAETPCQVFIPAAGEQTQGAWVRPTMIPAGVKTTVKGVETIAPRRDPTAEENQKIRSLIKEAFVALYGGENVELWLPTIDAPENLTLPVRAADLRYAFEKASEWMSQKNTVLLPNDESFLAQYPKMPVDVANAVVEHQALAKSDESIRQKDQDSFEKAYESLDSPNALGRAAWSAGETVARSAGVVGGTIAGVALKAAGGVAVGFFEFYGSRNLRCCPRPLDVGAAFGLDDNEVRVVGFTGLVGMTGVFIATCVTGIAHYDPLVLGLGSLLVTGAVPAAVMAAPDVARRALDYCAPGEALAKAREALMDWSGESANSALKIMQAAQETDLEAMVDLTDFFETFAPVENADLADQAPRHFSSSASSSSSSSAAVAFEETKADESAITPETLTPARARDLLIGQIKLRIFDREDLMMRLQNKIAAIAKQEREAKERAVKKYFSAEGRALRGCM